MLVVDHSSGPLIILFQNTVHCFTTFTFIWSLQVFRLDCLNATSTGQKLTVIHGDFIWTHRRGTKMRPRESRSRSRSRSLSPDLVRTRMRNSRSRSRSHSGDSRDGNSRQMTARKRSRSHVSTIPVSTSSVWPGSRPFSFCHVSTIPVSTSTVWSGSKSFSFRRE
jgi:hypothetical protein